MIVRLEDDALRDLQEGFDFYETCEKGAGWYFLDKIKIEINELRVTGGIHRKCHGFHCCVSARFPFCFYYRVTPDSIKVYAVLDGRRDPDFLREILSNR